MVDYPNFYESVNEARMRLDNTVVLYNGEPYFVLCVTDHKPDGIFRVFLDPTKNLWASGHTVPSNWMDEPGMSRGQRMDKYLDDNPTCGILRRHINSPLFRKFRPFPLGFVNDEYTRIAVFTERSPARHTQQGLTQAMLTCRNILGRESTHPVPRIDVTSRSLADTITNTYPTLEECYSNIVNPDVVNKSAAFHRNFAVFQGPLNTAFLAYKSDIVGVFSGDNHKTVKLGKGWSQLKESIQELGMFDEVSCS